jgi:hypothetical protein
MLVRCGWAWLSVGYRIEENFLWLILNIKWLRLSGLQKQKGQQMRGWPEERWRDGGSEGESALWDGRKKKYSTVQCSTV